MKKLTVHYTDGEIKTFEVSSTMMLPHLRIMETYNPDSGLMWIPMENTFAVHLVDLDGES